MKLVMHSYTFRTYPFEEAIRSALRFGWAALELQPCHFDRNDIENELPKAAALANNHGIPIHCVDFSGDFINDDAKIRETAVAGMETYIKTCAANGIHLLNGSAGAIALHEDWGKNGSALATDAHYEIAAEAFRHLGKVAAQHKVEIVFEIHMNTIHDTIASTRRILDMIKLDNVMANPDPGNMFGTSTAERDPEALDQLEGRRIGYMHFKNCEKIGNACNYSVKLADGHIDVYKWVEKLVKIGYDRAICIEYCGEGDPHVAAEQDIAYMRKCLDWTRP